MYQVPGSLVVRIPRSHRGGRGSIPRLGNIFFPIASDIYLKNATALIDFFSDLLFAMNLICIVLYLYLYGSK